MRTHGHGEVGVRHSTRRRRSVAAWEPVAPNKQSQSAASTIPCKGAGGTIRNRTRSTSGDLNAQCPPDPPLRGVVVSAHNRPFHGRKLWDPPCPRGFEVPARGPAEARIILFPAGEKAYSMGAFPLKRLIQFWRLCVRWVGAVCGHRCCRIFAPPARMGAFPLNSGQFCPEWKSFF